MQDNHSVIQKSISFLLVALIAVFALSSFGNVREYIAEFHAGWTSWALGGGFSVAVFVCAYLAATAKKASTKGWSIAVGVVFGVASGAFQYQLYREGHADVVTAALLSFIPILVGEVGLALVESSYSRERVEQQPSIDPTEMDDLRQQLVEVQRVADERKTVVGNLQNQLDSVRQELAEVRQLTDAYQAQLEQARQSLLTLQTQHDSLRKELDAFNPESVLSRLTDSQREKMVELFRLVVEQRITGAGDLVRAGMPKSDAYALWPVATAAQLVYLNGDGAYHVRGGSH